LLLLYCRVKNESYGVDLIEKLVAKSDSRVRPGVFGKDSVTFRIAPLFCGFRQFVYLVAKGRGPPGM